MSSLEAVVRAVLYEGYALYPYRRSSTKNRHRFTFGGLEPGGDAIQTECLVRGSDGTAVSVRVRFLQQLFSHAALEREAVAHEAALGELVERRWRLLFSFGADGAAGSRTVEGAVEVNAERLDEATYRLRVRVENLTQGAFETRDDVALVTFASTHTILGVKDGAFLSLTDPPAPLLDAARRCANEGTWPVLAGEPGLGEAVLSSPIILYDYPEVAKESPGDLFDATEIDEILTLRILTLTDAEKREAAAQDPRVGDLIARTEALSQEDLMRLHGAMRAPPQPPPPERGGHWGGARGDKVVLRPKRRADAFDMILAGKTATIVKVERDLEGRVQYAVTVDDDPGRDLGAEGRPAHRFFFAADEVEPLGGEP